jgi:hypothetical protein
MPSIRAKYKSAKAGIVGDKCDCPSCGTEFVKTNYQQAFCKTKGKTRCKDKYWNTVIPEKRNNTTRISPASARFTAKQEEYREENFNPDDQEHIFSSEAHGQS